MRIVTVTPSTAIDEVLEVKQVQQEKPTLNTIRRLLFPSGKGINVARAVSSLGRDVMATGFVGEKELHRFESLRSKYLSLALTPVAGETRMNTTVCDVDNLAVLHIRRQAFTVGPQQFTAFERRLKAVIAPGDVVVFAGTLPPRMSRSGYARLIEYCGARGMITIVDSSGDDLAAAIRGKPFMIKPNVEELAEFTGKNLVDYSASKLLDVAKYAASEVRVIVVSRGAKGVLVWSRETDQAWIASVDVGRKFAPTAAIGSGDALVGAFAIGLLERMETQDIIRLGVACGAANLLCVGPGVFRRADVEKLSARVRIEQL
jgi:1-phosphofructokinase family hexose kinase